MFKSDKPLLLVSGCLIGETVRYDGKTRPMVADFVDSLIRQHRVLAVCPETMGGLPVPRDPCEIEPGKSAAEVFRREAKILTRQGRDCTEDFIFGAENALQLARHYHVCAALLKQKSPSCGTKQVYDGTFSRALVPGTGLLGHLLQKEGIPVFDETELDRLQDYLKEIRF